MKHIILICAAGAVAALLVYFMLITPAEAPTVEQAETVSSESQEQSAEVGALTGAGTLAEFFTRDESVYCTFSGTYDEGVVGEGEFWYANRRLRVEATTRVDGELYTSNMINDGSKTYIWGGTAAGMQAMVITNDNTAENYESYTTGQSDARLAMDQQITYRCQAWSPDTLTFVPPTNIEFLDMEQMMQGYFDGELRGMPEGMDF